MTTREWLACTVPFALAGFILDRWFPQAFWLLVAAMALWAIWLTFSLWRS